MSIFGKSRNEKGHEVRQFMTARYRDDGHFIVADHLLSSLAQPKVGCISPHFDYETLKVGQVENLICKNSGENDVF